MYVGACKLTVSDSRASPGSKVSGASLCLSMASNTRTNLHRGSLVGSFSMALRVMDSCANVSHRLCMRAGAAGTKDERLAWTPPPSCKASITEATMRSNKCLVVMHCDAFTTA